MALLAIRPSRFTGTVQLELQSENFHIVLSKLVFLVPVPVPVQVPLKLCVSHKFHLITCRQTCLTVSLRFGPIIGINICLNMLSQHESLDTCILSVVICSIFVPLCLKVSYSFYRIRMRHQYCQIATVPAATWSSFRAWVTWFS